MLTQSNVFIAWTMVAFILGCVTGMELVIVIERIVRWITRKQFKVEEV